MSEILTATNERAIIPTIKFRNSITALTELMQKESYLVYLWNLCSAQSTYFH